MAKIDLRYPKYCPFTDVETEALGVGKVMALAIKADIKINTTDAELYANGGLAESIKEFTDGTLTQEVDDVDQSTLAELLGFGYTEGGELTANVDNVAPFCRVGFIITRLKNNVKSYRVVCFLKVKYSIPSDTFETKGKTTTFQTTSMEGTIYRNKDGDWKKEKTFTSMLLAETYLNSLLNMTIPALTLTSIAGTATGATKLTVSPTLAEGNSYMFKTATTVTLPLISDLCNIGTGYTAWDGTVDITATTANEIAVVEIDSAFKAVKAGEITVTSKA